MAIRYAVEIETHIPVGACNRGPHGRGAQVEWLPPGWLGAGDWAREVRECLRLAE